MATEENDGIPLPAYEVIMDAVKYSLEEKLLPEQQVIYSSRYGEIAIKNPNGTVINFSALSDGYRNVIKIVTDIATKMCILNTDYKEIIDMMIEERQGLAKENV